MPSIIDALNAVNKTGRSEPVEFTRDELIPLIHCNEITASLELNDFVQNLLCVGGLSVVYGPSNTGKSFWALDLAASVACNRKFRGVQHVDRGYVIYVTLEGQSSFDNRIAALRASGLLPEYPFLLLVKVPVCLLDAHEVSRIIASIKDNELMGTSRLVIIDTLSRAMAGGDENSAVDMTTVVDSADAIRQATRAHVMLIHHCGKDAAKGARGHTSLRAAVDTEIEISRDEEANHTIVKVTKQRDLPIIPHMAFTLESVSLGQNKRGEAVTSCIVKHVNDFVPPTAKTRGFKKIKTTPSQADVLKLIPQGKSIQKKLLVAKIREHLDASERAASSIIMEMCDNGTLKDVKVKSESGQDQMHVCRALKNQEA